jgi:hypothetical protein
VSEEHCVNHPPAKARTARCAREQDRGGGYGGAERRRVRRAGTRSGYGSTGGRGFFGGAVAVMVSNRARFSRAPNYRVTAAVLDALKYIADSPAHRNRVPTG